MLIFNIFHHGIGYLSPHLPFMALKCTGPWLWEETHVPKTVSSNPGIIYWMDIFSHLFAVKIVMCV